MAPRAAQAREQRRGVSVDLYHLLLYKIKFHLCCTFILSINLALKKSPRVQSHLFFDFASTDVTAQLQSVPSQRTKADTDALGALPLVHPGLPAGGTAPITVWTTAARDSQSMRIKVAAGHRLHQPVSSSTKPVLPAGLLGTSRHSDVVMPSPGSRASRASLWAGLDQGLRGSLCPWYKSE